VPEMLFTVQWPDGSQQEFSSPSLIVEEYLEPGTDHPVADFVRRSHEALGIASDRVKAKYGMPCSLAAGPIASIERAASGSPVGTFRSQASDGPSRCRPARS
jgi:uncharacterized repeat protein (TIGR04042 family)